MMMMSNKVIVIASVCIAIIQIAGLVQVSNGADNDLTVKCSTAIQQLTSCLTYVTSKKETDMPSKECCSSITDMRNKQPVCLCFFIGQAHNGSEQIKSLGIQESRLLQLPSACQLVNANVTNCPKLLGISPSSPAAAIFMNNNATTPAGSTSSPSSSSSSSSATPAANTSSGFKHASNGLIGGLVTVSVSIFLSAFPVGNLQLLF